MCYDDDLNCWIKIDNLTCPLLRLSIKLFTSLPQKTISHMYVFALPEKNSCNLRLRL